jgi:hypothetical protein
MRRILLFTLLMIAPAFGREITELRDRVRDGVQRTDKDLAKLIHRDKLNPQQREKLDAAVKDLGEIGEAVKSDKWQSERDIFERAVDNIDYLVKNAAIDDADKQTLGIDVYSLQVLLDSWKK